MPHVMRLKDGKLITPFDIHDVLEAVEEYTGDEPRKYLEENIADAEELGKELDAEYKEHEEELERVGDHHCALLNDIRCEAESLTEMLDAQRLDRKKLRKAANAIIQMCSQEL